jgi:iron(III) transport system permease protein
MIRRHWLLGLLLALYALPLAVPFFTLLTNPIAWDVWHEAGRLLLLARNTLLLVVGTVSVALPAGVLLALILYRTDLPARNVLRFLLLLSLFVPLPLFLAGWQVLLSGGVMWRTGLGAAVLMHALAGLPWVVLLVGQGLCWVERELEEEAWTCVPAWRVMLAVTLPRCRVAVAAAGLFVALQAMGEIAVADMMQVRTYAEEVHTQMVRPEPESGVTEPRLLTARAFVLALPAILLAGVLVFATVRGWESRAPASVSLRPPLRWRLGRLRGVAFLFTAGVVVALAAVPLVNLIAKAGAAGHSWSFSALAGQLVAAVKSSQRSPWWHLLLALGVGSLSALAALVLCWRIRESRRLQIAVLGLLASVWALPGPVVGLGLSETIRALLDLVPSDAVASALYYGSSSVPVAWAQFIRLLPCAVALLWPVVRALPRELIETARLEGATPWQELRRVVLPLTAPALLGASLAIAALSLGELSASKLVSTPGAPSFAEELFAQMHYGFTSDLAARCLVLLAMVWCVAAATKTARTGSGRRDTPVSH